jgi:hypothetical protein
MMRFVRNLRAAARQSATDSEMTDEMRFHIEMEARDLVANGMPADEALRIAHARFGGTTRYREEGREIRGSSWFSDLRQDVRYAWRTLGQNRAYAAVSILTLAIAIGSSATMFGVMNGVLLKPLPFPRPDKLFQIWDNLDWVGVPEAWVTGPEVASMRENLHSFAGIAVIRGGSAGIGSDGSDPEQVNFSPVSANFFAVVGRGPELGRGFLPEEDVPDGPRVAIISHALFQRRFASDRSIVGKTMLFDGNPTTIVGVLPRDFQYALQSSLSTPLDVDVYTPIQVSLARAAFQELNPGQPIQRLTTMNDVVKQSLGQARLVLVIIATFAGTALLLAAIGIYGVTSTAVTARSREMGIRIALGARPPEVLKLALEEPIGLVALGAVVGLGGTVASRSLLAKLVYGISPTDPVVVGSLTILLVLLAALAAAIPARRVMRTDAARVLRAD